MGRPLVEKSGRHVHFGAGVRVSGGAEKRSARETAWKHRAAAAALGNLVRAEALEDAELARERAFSDRWWRIVRRLDQLRTAKIELEQSGG